MERNIFGDQSNSQPVRAISLFIRYSSSSSSSFSLCWFSLSLSLSHTVSVCVRACLRESLHLGDWWRWKREAAEEASMNSAQEDIWRCSGCTSRGRTNWWRDSISSSLTFMPLRSLLLHPYIEFSSAVHARTSFRDSAASCSIDSDWLELLLLLTRPMSSVSARNFRETVELCDDDDGSLSFSLFNNCSVLERESFSFFSLPLCFGYECFLLNLYRLICWTTLYTKPQF